MHGAGSKMIRTLFGSLVVFSCAKSEPGREPPETPWTSGSRLRARVLDGGEGARLFVEWMDTELAMSCAFVPAEDGELRCLPTHAQSANAEALYADAQCTERVFELEAGLANVRHYDRYLRVTTGSCDEVGPFAAKMLLGEARDVIPFHMQGGQCVPLGNVNFWVGAHRFAQR